MSAPILYRETGVTADDVLAVVRDHLGERLLAAEVRDHKAGIADAVTFRELWIELRREDLLSLVDRLFALDAVHFHVMSGDDVGDAVMLDYHFSLFNAAGRGARVGVFAKVLVPKTDLVMPSLWSRIPGVEYSEREMKEFLGVRFEGLPNDSAIFLPEDWNPAVKPWRRDETAPGADLVRELC